MILQSLYEYYQRKSADPDSGLAPSGFEWKDIPFLIVINVDGEFVDIEDTQQINNKKKVANRYLVPQSVKRSRNVLANLLWDSPAYALGIDAESKAIARTPQQKAFVEKTRDCATKTGSTAVASLLKFLESDQLQRITSHRLWNEFVESKGNVSFRLSDLNELICQMPEVQEYVSCVAVADEAARSICLVTGQISEIERIHASIKGVRDAQSSGANIVSFNEDAFCSYGKEQGSNAPMCKSAVFSYTSALNHVVSKGSDQKIQVGDATAVFWAEKNNQIESLFSDLFGVPSKDEPDRNIKAVRSLYTAPKSGSLSFDDDQSKFFVLGLAPNASRIAVRFWQVCTVSELAINIRQHFDDISIAHAPHEPEYLSLFRLLVSTATQEKSENVLPHLAGDAMKSILNGAPYPHTLLQAAIRRNKAEREVTYPRAALIKACLNRHNRFYHSQEMELTMALDEENNNIGYRLGRLFAVLEKIQEEANPGINATIRDRFYGAAASTPVTVFSNLMKLKNHHLSKLENRGRAVNLEKIIGGIVSGIQDFPAFLSLGDQGRFAIGYYHQRQNFFVKSENNKE